MTVRDEAGTERQTDDQLRDFLVDEHSQLFTLAGEPIWVTNDGRHIPLTKLDDAHLVAIQFLLRGDVARWGSWIGHVDGEITRRAQLGAD